MSLLDEFSSPILSNSMSTILSNHHLRACQELLELYIEQKRIDDAVCLLRRSREATKSLDPVHIWTLTKLVKHYCRVLGLDRATMFVSETMDEMNSVLSPESELQWNRNSYNPSKWLRYKQDCATWLRQLQHRANQPLLLASNWVSSCQVDLNFTAEWAKDICTAWFIHHNRQIVSNKVQVNRAQPQSYRANVHLYYSFLD